MTNKILILPIELDELRGKTYFDLGGLQYDLEERLPGGVDLVTKLNRHFEPYIKPDLIPIL